MQSLWASRTNVKFVPFYYLFKEFWGGTKDYQRLYADPITTDLTI